MKYFLCLFIGGMLGYFVSDSWHLIDKVKDIQLTTPSINTEINKSTTSPEIDKSSFAENIVLPSEIQKIRIAENIVLPSEIQKIRITENISVCLDSVNPDPENMTTVSDQSYGLKGLEAQLKKLKVELFSYTSLLNKLEHPISKKWSVIQDTNSKSELINLSFNLDDTDFLCQYDNDPKSPELTRVSRNGQVVFDIDTIAMIKEIYAVNREKVEIERRERLELKRKLDDEVNTYKKQRWKVEKYSNVEYKSYLKHHENTEFKTESPYLKITCLPSGPIIFFENTGVYQQENYTIYFQKDGNRTSQKFDVSGFDSEIGESPNKEDRYRFISLLKDSEEVIFNGFIFKSENLDQVPCLDV